MYIPMMTTETTVSEAVLSTACVCFLLVLKIVYNIFNVVITGLIDLINYHLYKMGSHETYAEYQDRMKLKYAQWEALMNERKPERARKRKEMAERREEAKKRRNLQVSETDAITCTTSSKPEITDLTTTEFSEARQSWFNKRFSFKGQTSGADSRKDGLCKLPQAPLETPDAVSAHNHLEHAKEESAVTTTNDTTPALEDATPTESLQSREDVTSKKTKTMKKSETKQLLASSQEPSSTNGVSRDSVVVPIETPAPAVTIPTTTPPVVAPEASSSGDIDPTAGQADSGSNIPGSIRKDPGEVPSDGIRERAASLAAATTFDTTSVVDPSAATKIKANSKTSKTRSQRGDAAEAKSTEVEKVSNAVESLEEEGKISSEAGVNTTEPMEKVVTQGFAKDRKDKEDKKRSTKLVVDKAVESGVDHNLIEVVESTEVQVGNGSAGTTGEALDATTDSTTDVATSLIAHDKEDNQDANLPDVLTACPKDQSIPGVVSSLDAVTKKEDKEEGIQSDTNLSRDVEVSTTVGNDATPTDATEAVNTSPVIDTGSTAIDSEVALAGMTGPEPKVTDLVPPTDITDPKDSLEAKDSVPNPAVEVSPTIKPDESISMGKPSMSTLATAPTHDAVSEVYVEEEEDEDEEPDMDADLGSDTNANSDVSVEEGAPLVIAAIPREKPNGAKVSKKPVKTELQKEEDSDDLRENMPTKKKGKANNNSTQKKQKEEKEDTSSSEDSSSEDSSSDEDSNDEEGDGEKEKEAEEGEGGEGEGGNECDDTDWNDDDIEDWDDDEDYGEGGDSGHGASGTSSGKTIKKVTSGKKKKVQKEEDNIEEQTPKINGDEAPDELGLGVLTEGTTSANNAPMPQSESTPDNAIAAQALDKATIDAATTEDTNQITHDNIGEADHDNESRSHDGNDNNQNDGRNNEEDCQKFPDDSGCVLEPEDGHTSTVELPSQPCIQSSLTEPKEETNSPDTSMPPENSAVAETLDLSRLSVSCSLPPQDLPLTSTSTSTTTTVPPSCDAKTQDPDSTNRIPESLAPRTQQTQPKLFGPPASRSINQPQPVQSSLLYRHAPGLPVLPALALGSTVRTTEKNPFKSIGTNIFSVLVPDTLEVFTGLHSSTTSSTTPNMAVAMAAKIAKSAMLKKNLQQQSAHGGAANANSKKRDGKDNVYEDIGLGHHTTNNEAYGLNEDDIPDCWDEEDDDDEFYTCVGDQSPENDDDEEERHESSNHGASSNPQGFSQQMPVSTRPTASLRAKSSTRSNPTSALEHVTASDETPVAPMTPRTAKRVRFAAMTNEAEIPEVDAAMKQSRILRLLEAPVKTKVFLETETKALKKGGESKTRFKTKSKIGPVTEPVTEDATKEDSESDSESDSEVQSDQEAAIIAQYPLPIPDHDIHEDPEDEDIPHLLGKKSFETETEEDVSNNESTMPCSYHPEDYVDDQLPINFNSLSRMDMPPPIPDNVSIPTMPESHIPMPDWDNEDMADWKKQTCTGGHHQHQHKSLLDDFDVKDSGSFKVHRHGWKRKTLRHATEADLKNPEPFCTYFTKTERKKCNGVMHEYVHEIRMTRRVLKSKELEDDGPGRNKRSTRHCSHRDASSERPEEAKPERSERSHHHRHYHHHHHGDVSPTPGCLSRDSRKDKTWWERHSSLSSSSSSSSSWSSVVEEEVNERRLPEDPLLMPSNLSREDILASWFDGGGSSRHSSRHSRRCGKRCERR